MLYVFFVMFVMFVLFVMSKTIFLMCRAFLAQMVERWPFKPMAVGSTPTEGVFLLNTVFFYIIIVKFI